MTLSDDKVIRQINHTFVSGWENIKGKTSYGGSSNTHLPTYAAKEVNFCSGARNVQMFFMTVDGRVLHCLPGFWSAKQFLEQVQFAVKLARVYYSKTMTPAERNEKFLDMHLQKAIGHEYAVVRGSQLQGFDAKREAKKDGSDFQRTEGFVGGLKYTDQVIHERMAARPFVPFEKFDTQNFADVGIKRYKYDFGVPGKDKYAKKTPKTTRYKKGYRKTSNKK